MPTPVKPYARPRRGFGARVAPIPENQGWGNITLDIAEVDGQWGVDTFAESECAALVNMYKGLSDELVDAFYKAMQQDMHHSGSDFVEPQKIIAIFIKLLDEQCLDRELTSHIGNLMDNLPASTLENSMPTVLHFIRFWALPAEETQIVLNVKYNGERIACALIPLCDALALSDSLYASDTPRSTSTLVWQ